MTDNKINMSLDDIIKKERQAKRGKTQMGGGRKQKKMGVKTLSRINMRKNRIGKTVTAAAAMRVVNQLVKRAIQQRANQPMLNRAARLRRNVLQRSSITRPAVRGFRARRRMTMTNSRLFGRLGGINRRSRVIVGGAARRLERQPVITKRAKVTRGRGVSRMNALVSDGAPVVIEEREIVRPMRQQTAVRMVPVSQPRRQVIVERPVVVEDAGTRRFGGVRKRIVMRNEPNVLVVKRMPARQRQFRQQAVYEREKPTATRFVGRQREPRDEYMAFNPNAVIMRKALGIGERTVERFEPSSSFLQRVPVENQRRRAFRTVIYE